MKFMWEPLPSLTVKKLKMVDERLIILYQILLNRSLQHIPLLVLALFHLFVGFASIFIIQYY